MIARILGCEGIIRRERDEIDAGQAGQISGPRCTSVPAPKGLSASESVFTGFSLGGPPEIMQGNLTNSGTASLTITQATISSAAFTIRGNFTTQDGKCRIFDHFRQNDYGVYYMAGKSDYRMLSTQGHKGRILIIADEPALLKTYSKSLSGSGFEVVGASRANEDLERLTRDRFDLVIADIVVPGVEGLEVLEQIQSRFPDVPVVVMLPAPDNAAALRAAALGVVHFLIKPIAAEAMKATAVYVLTTTQSRNSEPRRASKGEVQVRATLSVSATEAKNEFGRILETALLGKRVFITRHDAPKAVLISVDDFEDLSSSSQTKLDTLTSEFDRLLEEMQKPGTRSKLKAAFSASPKQLGTTAVLAAKKRA